MPSLLSGFSLLGFGVFIPMLLPGEGQSSCRHLQCLLLMLFFILCYISMESSSVLELSPGCGCRNSTHRRGCGFHLTHTDCTLMIPVPPRLCCLVMVQQPWEPFLEGFQRPRAAGIVEPCPELCWAFVSPRGLTAVLAELSGRWRAVSKMVIRAFH